MALALPVINAAPTPAALYNGLGALQVSLWELVYDHSPSFNYNLNAGVFQVTSSAAVTGQANAWLAAATLSAAVPTVHYFVANGPSHQDLLVTAAVPEPTSVALMLLGLAAVGGAAQRRRAQA
jgi:ABC-type glycerol-3-phosphate transport system permease component